jgi:hypothetical protein
MNLEVFVNNLYPLAPRFPMPFPALSPVSSDVPSPANAAATVAAGLVTATAGVTRNLEVMTQNAFRSFLNAFDTRA